MCGDTAAQGYQEDELLPLSALQHFAYCPRQFALIHIEQIWEENRFTAEGQVLHQRANSGEADTRGDLHVARSLRLVSHTLGLTGIADVVEFRKDEQGSELPGRDGHWRPFPVEYKRGRSKADDWDRLQLCAQAICLEEMLDVEVPEGAIFYGKPRRREPVTFNDALREKTAKLAGEMHAQWNSRKTPTAVYGAKCEHCSLKGHCMTEHGSASAYLKRMLES
jgi:CRISPR-associated exonuclease Cas4